MEMSKQRSFFTLGMLMWLFKLAVEVFQTDVQLLKVPATFLFFQACNASLEFMVRRRVFNFFAKVPEDSINIFVNISISLLHSFLVACSVVTSLIVTFSKEKSFSKMMTFESLYFNTWYGGYTVLAFSCGYFAYDQVDMLRRRLYSKAIDPLLIHHLIVLQCFTMALVRNSAINYLILTLLCEMHSVFLHWRRVGRWLGIRKPGSSLVLVEWILNWTTFFIARLLVHVYVLWKVYIDGPRFPNLELCMAAIGMLGFNVLDILLGLDLARACSKEQRKEV